MTPEEFAELQRPEIFGCIEQYGNEDPDRFAMSRHGDEGIPVRAIAEQIACRQKALRKLPGLATHSLLYTSRALEQASGERAAASKSAYICGETLLDLSGGLGIDSIFMARRFSRVLYCERDEVLSSVAAYNFRTLGVGNIEVHCGDSVRYLESIPDNTLDWVYVDPDRRNGSRRHVSLELSSPDVTALHDLILAKSTAFCVKTSPMLDISEAARKLPSLERVLVVSVDGECKELLLFCTRSGPDSGGPLVEAVCCYEDEQEVHIGPVPFMQRGRELPVAVGEWLLEPDPAILKAGLASVLGEQEALSRLNHGTGLLTGGAPRKNFPGRMFRIREIQPYKPALLKACLKKHGIDSASIQRRDFPLSVAELRRKFRLGESECHVLVFTRDASNALCCLVCERS